jgi:hypothetical protein
VPIIPFYDNKSDKVFSVLKLCLGAFGADRISEGDFEIRRLQSYEQGDIQV